MLSLSIYALAPLSSFDLMNNYYIFAGIDIYPYESRVVRSCNHTFYAPYPLPDLKSGLTSITGHKYSLQFLLL